MTFPPVELGDEPGRDTEFSRRAPTPSDVITGMPSLAILRQEHAAAQQAHDTAAELLNLYAQRAARHGHTFSLKPHDYEAFAEGFGFAETPDQSAAIDAVRSERRRRARELGFERAASAGETGGAVDARAGWLTTEVARLDEVAQALLRARFAEGGTLERIGARFGLGPAAAHGRIARALDTLRKRAGREGAP